MTLHACLLQGEQLKGFQLKKKNSHSILSEFSKPTAAKNAEFANLAIYLTPPTTTSSVLGCGQGLSQDVA
jgi:hypothetical protein